MQWDYFKTSNPDLAALGLAGWELIAHRPDGECIFKRPTATAGERFTREQTEHALSGAKAKCEAPRLLNPQLAALARRIGHTQMLLVCDRGFPVPHDLPLGVIDLSVTSNVPTVQNVLDAMLPELPHDRVIVAHEMQVASPERWAWHAAQHALVEAHGHQHFKQLAKEALACVRTGDATPYANVIVVGG